MTAQTKAGHRSALLAARRAVPEEVHRLEAEQLCGHLAKLIGDAHTVCAYLPVGTEPGSQALLDRLDELCEIVLLPVTRVGPDGEHLPLHWCRYAASTLVAARFGLREPAQRRRR